MTKCRLHEIWSFPKYFLSNIKLGLGLGFKFYKMVEVKNWICCNVYVHGKESPNGFLYWQQGPSNKDPSVSRIRNYREKTMQTFNVILNKNQLESVYSIDSFLRYSQFYSPFLEESYSTHFWPRFLRKFWINFLFSWIFSGKQKKWLFHPFALEI